MTAGAPLPPGRGRAGVSRTAAAPALPGVRAPPRRRHDRAVTSGRPSRGDRTDADGPGSLGPQPRRRCRAGVSSPPRLRHDRVTLPRPVCCDCPDSDGPGSPGPQLRRRCQASARLQGGDMTATSPRAVRVGATARTRTGRDLSDRSRAGAVGHQRASKAATRPRRHLGRAVRELEAPHSSYYYTSSARICIQAIGFRRYQSGRDLLEGGGDNSARIARGKSPPITGRGPRAQSGSDSRPRRPSPAPVVVALDS